MPTTTPMSARRTMPSIWIATSFPCSACWTTNSRICAPSYQARTGHDLQILILSSHGHNHTGTVAEAQG